MIYALHVTVDVATVGVVLGTVIPILVALVTKRVASPGTKAVVNLLLSAIAGALSVLVAEAQGTVVELEASAFVASVALTWVTSVATHYGLLKPTGITGAGGAVQRVVPGGLGSSAGDPGHTHMRVGPPPTSTGGVA